MFYILQLLHSVKCRKSLNHFSLSDLPVGATQKAPSCTGLESISLDTQLMQSETPHHLDFAGLKRRENVLLQDTFWGDFSKT